MAKTNLERAEGIHEELFVLMQQTNGMLTYEELSQQLGDFVCPNTIRAHLQSFPDFRVRKIRILPHLDEQAKEKRLIWAHTFYIFWESAKAVCPKKTLFLLMHLDEKWFYVIKTRCNQKVITSMGVNGKHAYAHHKSNVGKQMYIVMTGFSPTDNDFLKGGTAHMISAVLVGKALPAKKDSYKRVYMEDGTFHYPKIDISIRYFQLYAKEMM